MATGPKPMLELSFRSRRILYAVIAEYIATGEPVGSRRLSRRYGLNLSPASIRNVLADLEDAGLLAQPHTSAGRVPTDTGFRVFIDALIRMREVTSEDRRAMVSRMRELGRGHGDVMRETGRMLSAMTGTVSLVAPPPPDEEPLSQIRFIAVSTDRVLAVLVTASGAVQNRVVDSTQPLDLSEMQRLHEYLGPLVDGRTLGQVREALAREMASERSHYQTLSAQMRQVIEQGLSSEEAEPRVLIEGRDLLFGMPEFADAAKIRAFLRAFEERETLLDLLDRTMVAGGVQVLIGNEAALDEIEDISVISAPYPGPGDSSGTLGVIGPARMDYEKVVPIVQLTAHMMGRVLADEDPDDGAAEGEAD